MVTIQPIEHEGHVVALVVGGRALIDPKMSADALPLVQATMHLRPRDRVENAARPVQRAGRDARAHDVLAAAAKTLGERPPVIRLPARRARRVNA